MGEAIKERWDRYFLGLALAASRMSRDPSTRVGSIIVLEGSVISTGWNGFPQGIAEDSRMDDREVKLKLMVHGEMRAILSAARVGTSVQGATLYTACEGTAGIWGGPPCTRCAVECIEAGIREVVSYPFKSVPSRWLDDLRLAELLLQEAHVIFRSVPLPT